MTLDETLINQANGARPMRRWTLNNLQLLTMILLSSSALANSTHIAVPAQQNPGIQGLLKASSLSKASHALARAFTEYRAHVARGSKAPFQPSNRFLQFSSGRVVVEARAWADGEQLFEDLEALGLQRGARAGNLISGTFPIAAVDKAVALAGLRSISATPPPVRHAGSVTSQGDIALRAAIARSSFSVDGTGITVGVLSDSYDSLNGAAADIVSGDLPPGGVPVLGGESAYCGTYVFCIDEGRAMLQIIHDLAPGANLLFHTAIEGKASYANAIQALADAGADVIVDDLQYLNEPMFQDGVVAQAVDAVVADGVAYFSAAGNAGRESYQAPFDDSGEVLCVELFEPYDDCNPYYERVGRMHDFDPGPGVTYFLPVTIPLNSVLTIAMQWDEPFGGPGPDNDHDVVLLDKSGGYWHEISANDNVLTGEGWEVLQYDNNEVLSYETEYLLAVTYDDVDSVGPPATLLKMVIFGNATFNGLNADSPTLFGHANAAGAQAIGAAFFVETPEFGVSPPALEPYSSAGGTPILFGPNAQPLGEAEVREKPDMTAADGVNTTFFFSDSYGGDGIDDFFGTSAAAPHAAAIAALMLDARPNATPAELRTALQSSAIDMNETGFDFDSGYGLVQADAAITALLGAGGNSPPQADFTTLISDLQVNFTDTSSDSDGTVTTWAWNFGDGNTSSQQNPSHSYSAAGSYSVSLTVTDNDGDSDSASQFVSVSAAAVNQPPVASFAYSCNERTCSFDSSLSSDDSGIVSYDWDFGDGHTSSAINPSHTYESTGNFTVDLVVSDGDAETSGATATFRVKNKGRTSGVSTVSDGGDAGGGEPTSGGSEKGRKKCTDGQDNDGDGLIDGDDPDC